MSQPDKRLLKSKIHFVAIGGIGMSALARYCYAKGAIVSGSDKEKSDLTKELESEGINNIWSPHKRENIEKVNPDYVIYSTAIDSLNEELNWAKEKNKQILHRSELLEFLTLEKKLIAISGTHGKTTTTAMITEMLLNTTLEPSSIIGGILTSNNTNIIVGNGDYFIVEADESDKSFLKGNPEIGIITNIEPDHLENYKGGFNELLKSFMIFAENSIKNRGLVYCRQDKNTRLLIEDKFNSDKSKLISYGLYSDTANAFISAKYILQNDQWVILVNNKEITSLKIKQPGKHNILNALAAFGTGYLLGISPEKIKISLERYSGVKRRFEVLLKTDKIMIVDDYAHHPTEISATIKAAKELKPNRLIAIVQPHQALRLKDLWNEFKETLSQEDFPIYITDTYIARGKAIEGITSEILVKEINKSNINYLSGNIEELFIKVKEIIKPGDLLLVMGAGNITQLGYKLSLVMNDYFCSK